MKKTVECQTRDKLAEAYGALLRQWSEEAMTLRERKSITEAERKKLMAGIGALRAQVDRAKYEYDKHIVTHGCAQKDE